MTVCTQVACTGNIAADGYCDTCGAKASTAATVHPHQQHSQEQPGSGAAAPVAALVTGAACNEVGCTGAVSADGYCDTCGVKATGAPATSMSNSAGALSAAVPSIAAPRAPGTSGRLGTTGASRRTDASSRTGATRRLGAGLVAIAPTPAGDPAQAVMSAEKVAAVLGIVAEDERFCSSCGQPVGRSEDEREGRVSGFCSNCRTQFDFHTNSPTLGAGDLVANQYEVLGPIAHGGMGWIYLGRDRAVSDRWVVLKGLLNENDPDAAAAAVAERQFLAQIEHGNIVNIYNFATHEGRGYIVMEYVGGESLNGKLKDRRRANGGTPDPLPIEQAISYILGILPAFGYLHGLGLVYNDLKPANIMSVGDDVKLIDVGAVMRADDQQAAIFGTAGFQAPEVASMGPSVSSDLYTVGRTLAVLMLDFLFHVGDYQYRIPPPREQGILRQWESLHRFLLKATAEHPDDRFQTAANMAEQLTGVLREVVAVNERSPRPVHSRIFGGDRLTSLLVDDAAVIAIAPEWRSLPRPKIDPEDPEAAYLEDLLELDAARGIAAIEGGLADASVGDTPGIRLHLAYALIETGRDPEPILAAVELGDPWDWRVNWYRALASLAYGNAARAAEAFSAVWTELPGELAPPLGAALAAEQADQYPRAAELYERVVSVDSTYVSAAFGLARCRAALGDRGGAVEAYRRVPSSSATYADAQVASARAMVVHDDVPTPADLELAASTVERLQLDAQERAALSAEILERALEAQHAGKLGATGSATLFGHPLDERGIRRGLESTYREMARLATRPDEKFRLVDKANAVRPRTLV